MKDLLDAHMHTIASGHAYSTVREMVTAAKEKGLKLIGLTEHAPAMPGTCNEIYFYNLRVIRPEAYGIDILKGAELNILDYSGSTDLRAETLKKLDYAIASLHEPCIAPGTKEENTRAIVGAMRNPKVRIIGHPDNPHYPVDFDRIARTAAVHHVMIEINTSSYRPGGSRYGARELVGELLAACRRAGTMVIMGSDAHIDLDVGNHEYAREMIEKYDFPEELVINSRPEDFKAWIERW